MPFLWEYAHECRCPQRLEASDLLELELLTVVSHLTGVMRTDLGSLEHQQVLLTIKSHLSSPSKTFLGKIRHLMFHCLAENTRTQHGATGLTCVQAPAIFPTTNSAPSVQMLTQKKINNFSSFSWPHSCPGGCRPS